MLLASLFASVRLFQLLSRPDQEPALKLLGLPLPTAALWAAGLFAVLAGLTFLVTFGLGTGLKGLDSKTHALIDMLIDTESELAKVSWPGPEELTRSTTAVLVSVLLLGAFLFCVDWLMALAMGALKVLPK
ncbi:MAG: preprotein translocase subunit SecE [Planctomycetota bacterium]|jgi:preprotein translocase SecE subunit